MPTVLQVLTGKRAGTKYELKNDEVRIGRHPDCDIPLDGNSVSRFHAHLTKGPTGYAIEDQKSRNGTQVNGRRIEVAVSLNDNDRVKICETLFVYRVEPDPSDQLEVSTTEAAAVDEDDRPSTVLSMLEADGSSVLLSGVKPEAKLRAIFEISQAIAQTLELDAIFDKILECSFRVFPQADRAMVLQMDAQGRLFPRASRRRHEDDDNLRFSRTVVQKAMAECRAILSADASNDERFSMSESIADFRIRSVMCVPLVGMDKQALGVIQLDTQNYIERFSEDDLQVLASVANQASIAMENARLHEATLAQERIRRELVFARQVQQGFLPRSMPKVDGYEFWAFYEAAGQVGGDYYDFLTLPNGKQAALVADVSGKGVPAALLMARFSSDVKVSLITHPDDLSSAVVSLNRILCEAMLDDRFVTMLVAVLDPASGVVQVVNAGHMAPMVRRKEGQVEEPAGDEGTASLPLGILPDATYPHTEFTLAPGELAVVYSDGINEAMNMSDQQFSADRLRKVIGKPPASAKQVGEALIRDVKSFSAGRSQHDDMTLVVFSRSR